MKIEGFEYLVDGYIRTLTSTSTTCTKNQMWQMQQNVLRQFGVVAKLIDKMDQPSRHHADAIIKLEQVLARFIEALDARQSINLKLNPEEKSMKDLSEEAEKARIEETNKKLVGRVRKRRKQVAQSFSYEPEAKSRVKSIKEWITKDVVDSIPTTPPYPAFFFKKLNKPCVVRKVQPVLKYGKKEPPVYVCIFDNGDVSYLATDAKSSGEDKVRANLRELRSRGHTRKTFTEDEIVKGLLERGFDPEQVHAIAKSQRVAEVKQFWLSTGSKVFVKSIPPGKEYDNKLGIILGMRLSMTEHPVEVTSFVGESVGQSHNVRVFKVFFEDETIRYVWGEEIAHEIEEGTHEAVVLDALYEKLEERKKEEAEARMHEFASMIHEYEEDEDFDTSASQEPEKRAPGADNFKYRVRRLVKDD